MARAYGEVYVVDRVGKILTGVAVDLLDPVTLLRIGDTVFADSTSGTTLSLPLTTGSDGKRPFYLASGKTVVASTTVGGSTYTDTIAVVDPTATGSTSSATLTDSVVSGVAKGQLLVYTDDTPPKLINISHKRYLRGYRVSGGGFKGDGSSDDTTVINQAISDASTKGWVEAPPGLTICAQNILMASNVVFDGNDSTFQLVTGAAAGAHVFTNANFGTLTGNNSTGGIYRYQLRNVRVDGNRANNASGGDGIAIYGIGQVENVIVYHTHGRAAWFEWSNTGNTLDGLGLAVGDQTQRVRNLEAYDCDLAAKASGLDFNVTPIGAGAGITAVTNVTNPQITTAQNHLLRVGQSITIANVLGATGVNGVQTVRAIVDATNFTITAASPGVFSASASSTITSPSFPMVALVGIDSPQINNIELWQSGTLPTGSFALFLACSASIAQDIHIYENFATAVYWCNGNNSQATNVYCGGQDRAFFVAQNGVQATNLFMTGASFSNAIGLDYQSVGGNCKFSGKFDGLTTGGINVRIWNTSKAVWDISATGDGGSNTSVLYTDPNTTSNFHGVLTNLDGGVNASPATRGYTA